MGSRWQFCTGKVSWLIDANAATLTTVAAKIAQTPMPTSTDPSFTSTLCHYCVGLKSSGCLHLVRAGVFLEGGSSPCFFYTVVLSWDKERKKEKWCFLYVSFDIIFAWAGGICKHSLNAAFSVGATQLYGCITSPLHWQGHILFSLRVASLSRRGNCSK